MFEIVGGFFKRPRKKVASASNTTSTGRTRPRNDSGQKQTFSKVFRWQLPAEQQEPASVEVVGSFTNWRPVPLERDRTLKTWQVTLRDLPGNRTHHYMVLVDGEPVYDHTCDGLTVPANFEEEQFQLMTPKGPRVFMLFSQTK